MIRRHNIGFFDSDSGGPRRGSCIIFWDDVNNEVIIIDGYTSTGAKKLKKWLKDRGIKSPWLYLTHAHGDHTDGFDDIVEDEWFTPKGFLCYDPESIKAGADKNSEIKQDYDSLVRLIKKCKNRGIPVKYLHSSDTRKHGDIRFKVYREQPRFKGNDEDPHGWEYVNDGSLIFWFYELGTLVTGDGPESLGDFCKKRDIHAKDFQISHHGGCCPKSQANLMKSLGAVYCWDDNYVGNGDSFVQYGRNRCIEAGIKHINIHGDINVVYFSKRAVIYKNGQIYRYSCTYTGKPTLKDANADIVRKVMQDKYGTSDTRTTKLLDEHYNPGMVQKSVNQVISTAKGILSGKLDYGKNQTRIARLDKELGSGYGQLVQDYINVLCGVRKQV